MEGFTLILSLLSGVALFLFGMSLMGDGLKKAAGEKLELILYRLTNTPLKGILLGTAVTAIIQSSSATTVMVVGFVNAGMMKVSQAIGIIMGANIGTSITGWILCLSYIEGTGGIAQLLSTATISAVVAVIGIIFKMFMKKASYHNVGDIMLGFSILMVGMQTMSGAVSPLKSNEHFVNALTMFSNPFMGIGVGAACPVLLSSIGTNKNGKRTALIYLINDLFGMLLWSTVFYTVDAVVHFAFMDLVMNPVRIALLNTVFRMATILVLCPFIKGIEKLVFVLVRDTQEDKEDQADFDLLEERFLAYPPLAIAQSHQAMNGMAKKVKKNIGAALGLLTEYSEEQYHKIQEKENLIDKYEDKLGTYLMQLTGREMTIAQNSEVSKFLHTLSDFERLGDHASNISKVANELYEKKTSFSKEGMYELGVLESAVSEIVDLTVNAFMEDDQQTAYRVEPLRELIGILCDELKLRHIKRLQHGKCELKQGFAFNDLLANLERIGAHCSNVAVAMIELGYSEFDIHGYVKTVRERKNSDYAVYFEEYEEKYDINGYKKAKKAKKEEEGVKGKKGKEESKKKK